MHLARRPSVERTSWSGENGVPGNHAMTRSRMASLERGARIAETGTLIPRSRRQSATSFGDISVSGHNDQKQAAPVSQNT